MSSVSTPIRMRTLLRSADESFSSPGLVQDDEIERQERRKSLAASPRKSVSTEEVKSHMELCQKMFIANKITPKNAWNLRIIDYFMMMVNMQKSDKEPLQTAASALEICTKVYSCRVDYLHAEGMKMANSFAAHKEKTIEENSAEEAEDVTKPKKKKKPQLALNSEQFISKDIDSMLGPIPQLPHAHFAIETDGDPEQTINMFTLTVPFDQNYHDHLRDKETPCFLSYHHTDVVNEEVIEKYVPKIKSFRICKEFENFEVNVTSTDFNNSMISLNASHMQNATAIGQSIYDQNGQPIVELDGSIHDVFADQHIDSIHELEEINDGCHRAYQDVQIVSFGPDQGTLKEHTLNNTLLENMSQWVDMVRLVGPNHWKNKMLKRSVSRYSGASIEPKMKKRRLPPQEDGPVDFLVNPPRTDFAVKSKPSKRVTDESKYLVHRNYLKKAPNDQMLILMDYRPTEGYRAGEKDEEEEQFNHECQDYNYNNLNDSQYCLAANNEDEPTDEPPGNGIQNDFDVPLGQTVEEEEIVKHQNDALLNDSNISLNMVLQSNLLFQVPYAMRSKKVNMKRIKATMLDILKEHGIMSKNFNNTPNEIKSEMFTKLCDQLDIDLPPTIVEEISIPIALFALLHLTNEKDLTLKMTEDYKDLIITNEIPIPVHLRE